MRPTAAEITKTEHSIEENPRCSVSRRRRFGLARSRPGRLPHPLDHDRRSIRTRQRHRRRRATPRAKARRIARPRRRHREQARGQRFHRGYAGRQERSPTATRSSWARTPRTAPNPGLQREMGYDPITRFRPDHPRRGIHQHHRREPESAGQEHAGARGLRQGERVVTRHRQCERRRHERVPGTPSRLEAAASAIQE